MSPKNKTYNSELHTISAHCKASPTTTDTCASSSCWSSGWRLGSTWPFPEQWVVRFSAVFCCHLVAKKKKKNHTDNRLLTFFFLSTIQVSLLRGILNVYRAFEEPKDKSVFGHSVRFSGLCTISKTTTGLFLRLFSMMLVIVIVKVKNL